MAVTLLYHFHDSYQNVFPVLAPGEELPGVGGGTGKSKAVFTALRLWGSEVRTCTGS